MSMTIEEMRERKRELGYSYQQIAELSGLPLGTVQKVLGGITKSPRYDTLKALEGVFGDKKDMMIREAQAAYMAEQDYERSRQGRYTLEDYYALPDDYRAELIDGVFYDMAAPTSVHQAFVGQVYRRLADYIDRKRGTCVPMASPLDVQLDCDDKTMVQPDLLVVCDRSKFQRGVVYGAPDLVIEVLSRSTRRKDMMLKLSKYEAAGVREYWIVDPDKKKVIVYDFESDINVRLYDFTQKVPVGIFSGRCKIDFQDIYEYISFLYE